MLTTSVCCLAPGQPTRALDLAHAYVADAPELIWQRTPTEALDAIRDSVMAYTRYELYVYSGSTLVGIAIAVPEEDDHVGKCLSVQWRFVLQEHRGPAGIKLQRLVLNLARYLQYKVVAYTKRVGDAKYELRYIKLRSN